MNKGYFLMECWDCGYEWKVNYKQCTCPRCSSDNVSNVWID